MLYYGFSPSVLQDYCHINNAEDILKSIHVFLSYMDTPPTYVMCPHGGTRSQQSSFLHGMLGISNAITADFRLPQL